MASNHTVMWPCKPEGGPVEGHGRDASRLHQLPLRSLPGTPARHFCSCPTGQSMRITARYSCKGLWDVVGNGLAMWAADIGLTWSPGRGEWNSSPATPHGLLLVLSVVRIWKKQSGPRLPLMKSGPCSLRALWPGASFSAKFLGGLSELIRVKHFRLCLTQ